MIRFKKYDPHEGQEAFHYAIDCMFRFVAMICGVRGGKTFAGAREATKQAWNSRANEEAVFGIIAPTYPMLKRTTWKNFLIAARPLIKNHNITDKIITLLNGREVHGFSADNPDRIRNVTMCGFWIDEARECPSGTWDVLLSRVLTTNGKGILTTSPNSFDWIHEVFIEQKDSDYGVIRFPTYQNTYIPKEAIEALERKYDKKFAAQEIHGEFVVFAGKVYYAFDRRFNASDLAFQLAQYNPRLPIRLCIDFNVSPMIWEIAHEYVDNGGVRTVRVFDEIKMMNTNTVQMCQEFKERFPNHTAGLFLYGDATGHHRDTRSHVTDWKIIKEELAGYNPIMKVPLKNPAQKDRINAMNAMFCNSKEERKIFVNPQRCKSLIRDCEQVPYKEGTQQIDDSNLELTHASSGLGYYIEKEFSLRKAVIEGLPI